jgi:NAD(P)-dependent dehydrogenase (short-subunit alcohol dehydrogenase family)
MSGKLTAIVSGASGGIGGVWSKDFWKKAITSSQPLVTQIKGSLHRGAWFFLRDIGKQQTAADAVETAIHNFGTVDVLANNAGIFLNKPFTDFTIEDFDALISTNLLGFFHMTQQAVREMLKQRSGCVVNITAALADRPIAGTNGSVSMITKGGLNSAVQNPAVEYAQYGI